LKSENRYVIPEMASRDANSPGGTHIVEDLADRIAELRDDGEPQEGIEPGHARALLAAFMELGRVRPELWRAVADPGDEEWLRNAVDAHGPLLAAAACARWDQGGWQKAAETLESCYFAEELPAPEERAALARELLEELDEVELAALAIERITGDSPGLAAEATKSAAWVAEHPDTFLAAGTFVRAMGESFRSDLVEHDPDLALTAEKFVRILETLQEAERVVTLADLQPSPAVHESLAEALKRWWTQLGREVCEVLSWRPPWPLGEPVLACGAAAAEAEGPRIDLRGPEDRWKGLLRFPPPGSPPGSSVRLWVRPWPEGLESGIVCGIPVRPEQTPDGARFVLRAEALQRGWESSALPVLVLRFADGRFEAAQVVQDQDPVSR
jgi:hypothetical protein